MKRICFWVYVWIFFVSQSDSWAVSSLPRLQVFEEKTERFGYRDFIQQPSLVPVDSNISLISYQENPVWVRIDVRTGIPSDQILKVGLVGSLKIDIYKIKNGICYDSVHTGVLRPLENKEIGNYFFLSDPSGADILIIRMETWPQSFFPIQWITTSQAEAENNALHLINGVYIGVMLLVCLLSFYYFLIFKDKIYLAYLFWNLSTGFFMFHINGIFNEYLTFGHPDWNLYYPATLIFSTGCYFWFVVQFLQIKRFSRILYFVFSGVAWLQVPLFIMFLFGISFFSFTQYIGSFFNLLVLIAAIYTSFKGHKPSRYLVVATLAVFIGGTISVLAINNVLPLNSFTSNALQLSLILEVFLFTMGLVEKSNDLRKETLANQGKIIEIMQENERIISENANNLERLVAERTKEIDEQNTELKQQHEELKILNERIHEQNELLDSQNIQLKHYNEKLEASVNERTQQLKQSAERLLMHNKKLEQYSYITSHNLRGPIARLMGLYNILDKNYIKDTPNQMIIDHMLATVNSMDHVIKDLSKILDINNKLADDYQKVELTDLVENLRFSLNTNEINDFSLITQFAEAPSVLTIKPYIQSIFYNLLSNSIKYRFPFRPLEVKISSHKVEGATQIKFSDNGLGFDIKSAENKLFQPFQRFHDKNIDGSGFGLFMVKLQLDNLGGRISLTSEPNVGTQISIFLPDEGSVPVE